MSMAARIVSCNVFLVSLFSYVGRVLLAPDMVRNRISEELRGFVLPVPVVKLALLAHMQRLFGISVCFQDIFMVNIGSLLAQAWRCKRVFKSLAQCQDSILSSQIRIHFCPYAFGHHGDRQRWLRLSDMPHRPNGWPLQGVLGE